MSQQRIGVVGLGLLGTALAERLIAGGYRVLVHNRTRSKADELLDLGAEWSDNPLRDCDTVVICLYTTEIVETVLGELGGLRPGHRLIDTTTGSPEATSRLGRDLHQRDIEYLECPIAASSEQTRRGAAIALVAGKRETFDGASSVIACLAPQHMYVGTWGNAARMKLVNNLVLGLNRAVLAEGLAFAQSLGLTMADTLAFLQQSNAASEVMRHKGLKMVERDFVPQAKLSQHLKDVRLMLDQASATGTKLHLTPLHARLLRELEESGHGELDNSAILLAFLPDGKHANCSSD